MAHLCTFLQAHAAQAYRQCVVMQSVIESEGGVGSKQKHSHTWQKAVNVYCVPGAVLGPGDFKHCYHYPLGFLEKKILFLPQGLCTCYACFLWLSSSLAHPAPTLFFFVNVPRSRKLFLAPLPDWVGFSWPSTHCTFPLSLYHNCVEVTFFWYKMLF